MNDDLTDFKAFLQQRQQAGAAYVNGDPAPLGRLVAHRSQATFSAHEAMLSKAQTRCGRAMNKTQVHLMLRATISLRSSTSGRVRALPIGLGFSVQVRGYEERLNRFRSTCA